MKEIDIETWPRKEHFEFFSRIAYPFYSLTVDIDVSAFHKFVKRNQLSFYYSMIYLSTKAMNQIEAFRYRIRGEKIVLLDDLIPSFTDMPKGSDLFCITNVALTPTIYDYTSACKNAVENQKQYFPTAKDESFDHYIYYSSVPWIHFTSVTHEMDANKDDAITRITFGKFEKKDEALMMPISIAANHRFVDGLHIHQYLNLLQASLNQLN